MGIELLTLQSYNNCPTTGLPSLLCPALARSLAARDNSSAPPHWSLFTQLWPPKHLPKKSGRNEASNA